jgi:hypothetical protein
VLFIVSTAMKGSCGIDWVDCFDYIMTFL